MGSKRLISMALGLEGREITRPDRPEGSKPESGESH